MTHSVENYFFFRIMKSITFSTAVDEFCLWTWWEKILLHRGGSNVKKWKFNGIVWKINYGDKWKRCKETSKIIEGILWFNSFICLLSVISDNNINNVQEEIKIYLQFLLHFSEVFIFLKGAKPHDDVQFCISHHLNFKFSWKLYLNVFLIFCSSISSSFKFFNNFPLVTLRLSGNFKVFVSLITIESHVTSQKHTESVKNLIFYFLKSLLGVMFNVNEQKKTRNDN